IISVISCLTFRLFSVILISIVTLLISCAEVSGPPGGPRDETAPTISSTMPISGMVNAPIGNQITITFSERIATQDVEEAIFITPRPDGEVKYSWKKTILLITLPNYFKTNTTYVISIGTEMKDLRGNKLEESFSFAFSTGETIADGSIKGLVIQENKPTAGITIGLYDYSLLDSILVSDSLYPPYLTQSGKDGEFEFNYLPDGKYFVLAFGDIIKNQFLNYPSEIFGLTDRFVVIDETRQFPALVINMTSVDTTTVSIISSTFTPDNLVKLRFSKNISCRTIHENLGQIFLIMDSSPDKSITAKSVRESNDENMSVFSLYYDSISNGSYNLKIGDTLLKILGKDSLFVEGPEFSVQINPDTVGPKIEYCSVNKKTIFPENNSFEIGFSEPMNSTIDKDSSVKIYDNDNIQIDMAINWKDDFRLGVTLDNPEWGKEYFVVVDESNFFDMAGNVFGDSISVYMFSTYNIDSLGEASGKVEYGNSIDSNSTPRITFFDISDKKQYSQEVINNQFKAMLPPGKYILSGFLDANNNTIYDSGSLDSIKLAETMAIGTDTIRVRARFETAGLIFKFE
ncbi:MAG: Ig-like domain-containing protein, partial [candidate division Zixibacteria bacterium]|nr:Ig-like domain-containing protein [candidate division Zixibacteria bacterium]